LVCGDFARVRLWSIFLDSQIELILVVLALAAILGSSIRQDMQQRNILFFKERKNAIVQHVGGD
jgi:hypothetical protein